MSIGKFSVSNPVLINILMITLLILGTFSVLRLPREQFAEVPFYWVNITVPYPGVSAEDIEQSVTVKVENELQGLDKLKAIQSVTREGSATIRVEFDDGISDDEFKRLYQETQTQFGNVSLPDGTLDPIISDFSAADFLPVIEVVLSGDVEYSVLNESARILKDRLAGIREISNIDTVGAWDRQVLVEVDREKLEALGISINEVVDGVRARNVTVPGGTLNTESREYLLRTVGEVDKYAQLKEVIVRRSSGGQGTVYVGDIAGVEEGFEEKSIINRDNGRQAISLKVAKVSGGSSTRVIDAVKEEVAQFRETAPRGIEISLFNDSSVRIRESINVLLANSAFGLVLLVLILLLFIGVRNALITALGIPVTFALTFLVLDYLGETFNTNTLFGLVLVLGLIVDHAIVIVENSYRLQQAGYSKIDAAIRGTNEVVKPVIAATATTVAAFLPLMLLPGIIGKFLRVIPLTVSIALIASTFEALVFLPAHFADWTGGIKKSAKEGFGKLKEWYEKLVRLLYRRRYITIAAAFVIMVGTFSLLGTVRQDLFDAEDFSLFYIDIEMPRGTTREKTNAFVAEYERKLLPLIGNGEVVAVNSYVGLNPGGSGGGSATSNAAQMIVDLTEKDQGRTRSILAIMLGTEALTASVPGAERVLFRKAQSGPPTDPPVSYRIFGDDYDTMAEIAEEIKRKLSSYEELYNIEDNLEGGTPELLVRVDDDAAARYGLSTQQVGAYIRATFDGINATTIFEDNREVEVIVRFKKRGSTSVNSLLRLQFPTPDGRQIPFSSLCTVEESESFAGIKRVDRKREVTIQAEAYDEENVTAINDEIKALFDADFKTRYPGVELQVGGEFAELNNLLIQIARIFLIGIFLIYVILGTQFNSYLQPLLILFSIPFAFVGIVLFLVVSGTPFSTTVLYAGVALAGIAVNDSIVLISFINDLRKEGRETMEAVVEAAKTRLRPIILTSVTTIAGLLPTALGLGGKSVVWGPMASTIIFGLFFSTLTALIVIPCLYGILNDAAGRRMKGRLKRKMLAE